MKYYLYYHNLFNKIPHKMKSYPFNAYSNQSLDNFKEDKKIVS